MQINLPLGLTPLALAMTLAVTPAAGQACFTNKAKTQFPVHQLAPPPAYDNVPDFAYYPAATFSSMNADAIANSSSLLPKYSWQWGNHGPRPVMKSNLAPGVLTPTGPTQLHFSTPAAANACTLAQTAATLGYKTLIPGYLRRASLTSATTPPVGTFTNLCILPSTSIRSKIEGVVIDYEVQDGRSSTGSLNFLLEYAALVHRAGKKAILYTNPLDTGRQALSGIDANNAMQIHRAYDLMSLFLWSGNRQGDIGASFDSQMAILGAPDPTKLYAVFELANTTLADARTVQARMKAKKISSVMLWRDGARQGGACSLDVNRKIACLAYGRCR